MLKSETTANRSRLCYHTKEWRTKLTDIMLTHWKVRHLAPNVKPEPAFRWNVRYLNTPWILDRLCSSVFGPEWVYITATFSLFVAWNRTCRPLWPHVHLHFKSGPAGQTSHRRWSGSGVLIHLRPGTDDSLRYKKFYFYSITLKYQGSLCLYK